MPGIVTKTERSWSDSQKAKDRLITNIERTGLRSTLINACRACITAGPTYIITNLKN